MLREAMEFFREQLLRGYCLHETPYKRVVVEPSETGWVAKERDRKPFTRDHIFATMEGFIDYLTSTHTEADRGIVFVGEGDVVARLRYGHVERHKAVLRLDYAEEHVALRHLSQGVGQKELWRLLVSRLQGCVDDSLLVAIESLRLSRKEEQAIEIAKIGLVKAQGQRQIQVAFRDPSGEGDRDFSVMSQWTFNVRFWECFQRAFSVETTLEVTTDGDGLHFQFHPRRLDLIERKARLDLVDTLRQGIHDGGAAARFTIHEGEYGEG